MSYNLDLHFIRDCYSSFVTVFTEQCAWSLNIIKYSGHWLLRVCMQLAGMGVGGQRQVFCNCKALLTTLTEYDKAVIAHKPKEAVLCCRSALHPRF